MGAFFLYNSDIDFDKESVKNTFSSKGFSVPRVFNLGNLTLWLYKKQLTNDDNFIYSDNENSLFVTGTVIYKDKPYRDGMLQLLKDFNSNSIDKTELKGAFCLLFLKEKHLYILLDKARVYHIFTNETNTILSSSFLAVLSAQNNKSTLNINACLEQLLTGFVTPPDSIISGITFFNYNYKNDITNSHFTFLDDKNNDHKNKLNEINGFQSAVETQVTNLENYYLSLRNFTAQNKIDIGLSGGFDSRLNLLLLKNLSANIQTHTYCSSDHEDNSQIAEKLADYANVPLKKIKLSDTGSKSEEELVQNFEDVLFFFDGRTNFNMGTYNDVHTRRMRISVLESTKFGLNGLGGELFRNREHISKKIKLDDWLKYILMKPSTLYALRDSNQFDKIFDYLFQKYKMILNLDIISLNDFGLYNARKMYRDIWIPYAAGIKNSAENQLAYFLMPFTDYYLGAEALKITPFIGSNGKFEAAMIAKLDKKAAAIASTYGYGFDKIPVFSHFKSYLKSQIPIKIKYLRHIYNLQKENKNNGPKVFFQLLEKYSIIKQIFNLLNCTKIPIKWDRIMLEKNNMERTLFLGYFLLRFSDKIEYDI